MLEELERIKDEHLTEWERDFRADLVVQLRGGRSLSQKQKERARRMLEKADYRASAALRQAAQQLSESAEQTALRRQQRQAHLMREDELVQWAREIYQGWDAATRNKAMDEAWRARVKESEWLLIFPEYMKRRLAEKYAIQRIADGARS